MATFTGTRPEVESNYPRCVKVCGKHGYGNTGQLMNKARLRANRKKGYLKSGFVFVQASVCDDVSGQCMIVSLSELSFEASRMYGRPMIALSDEEAQNVLCSAELAFLYRRGSSRCRRLEQHCNY